MHQMRETERDDQAFAPSDVARYALTASEERMNSVESLPAGTGFATTTPKQRSTMLLKFKSAKLPAHCLLASAQIQTKRFMGAPCAAAATSSPKLLAQQCDMSTWALPLKHFSDGWSTKRQRHCSVDGLMRKSTTSRVVQCQRSR